MLRTAFVAVWLAFYLIGHLPHYWKAKHLQKQGRREELRAFLQKQVSLWSAKVLRRIGMTLAVEGAENLPREGETVLYVSNHQSFLDIVIHLHVLQGPPPLMAKEELAHVPLLGGWIRLLGCILVEREDIRAAAAALREAEEMLQSGRSMIVYPEGTRSRGDAMGEFKAGAVRMALKAEAPIVPMAVDGAYRALEGNKFRIKPSHVRLIILPRIETKGLARAEQKALPGQLAETIRAAKEGSPSSRQDTP